MQASSILSRVIVEGLITSWLSLFTCKSFSTGWSSYYCRCNNTCWNQHFLLLDGIMRCSNLIIPCYLFSSPTLLKSNGLVLFLIASFFSKSPTWVGICFASNRHSFGYCAGPRTNTWLLTCRTTPTFRLSLTHFFITLHTCLNFLQLLTFHGVNVVIPLMI